jgi:phosphohistidine swiveling domain-containing protein
LLSENGFVCRAAQLRDFAMRSIPAREKAKFEFMRSVDATLETIARLGERLGFTRDDMSFLPVDRVERGATDSPTGAVHAEFRRSIEFLKKRWNLTCAIRLPHLVRSPEDVDAFQLGEWMPNFVSTRRVVAEPAVLDGGAPPGPLDGRIVLIRAADPGYDWIFGHPIAGLVTQYGGVGSHMAIRAAEFGLPAAIGCGEALFERLRAARLIDLDCTNGRVRGLA